MKRILTILLLLMPLCVLAQSDEAKKLYAEGVKLYQAKKYAEAIPFFEKSEAIEKIEHDTTNKSSIMMGLCYNMWAVNHYYSDNYSEAAKLVTKSIDIFKQFLGEEHSFYILSLNNLATYNVALGNYAEAFKVGSLSMELSKKVYGEEHPDYALAVDNLALYNSHLGNYTEAIRLGKQALEIRKKVLGEEHPDYTISLNHLANYYYQFGDYQEAIRLGTQAMEIKKKVLGEENHDYALSLNSLALYNSHFGNYAEAIKLGTQAMEINKKNLGEEHPDYAMSLQNLALYYFHISNYAEAIKLGTQAMEIYKNTLGEEHPKYAQSLHNLALYNSNIGNYAEAIRLGTQTMEIYKKVLGEKHPDYAMSLNNLAVYNSHLGNYAEAIKLGTQAMEINKKTLGEEHPDYARTVSNLANHYFKTGKYDEATMLFEQTYKRYESIILKTFAYLTTQERSNFWNTYSNFFNINLLYYAKEQPNSTLKKMAYDGQVLIKGLLLNAELEIQNLIEQQGNEQLKEMYYKITQDRKKLDELYQISPDKRTMNADSLQKKINNAERLLIKSSKELGDYTKNLSINWKDIQAKLGRNDIAIEFANFIDTTTQQNVYIALILKKGFKSPELVKLDFLDSDTADYSSPTLYNKIWKPLDKYLQGVQNVYFSPTSKFHTIGIEYLPNENNELFAKKYSAYRLSSTRELALKHTVNPAKKASVYGGIIYNFDESDWQNVAEEDAERAGETLTFLKGAKVEAEEITDILKNSSFNVEFGTDKAATEESFKKLSDSGIKILHVATHGFYEPETKENSFANMLSAGDETIQEDRSLSRSGLFFAGANTALNPEPRQFIPEGVDDGILTAKEISRMDFQGLDLVVLSACETGLGEVTGEGVFGLQRGFKKAGAQTMIISLWKVNDKPTKEFMTEFYRNLMTGKSKREAFILAQDKNRQKYIDPKMWAGFIMVDGY